MKQKLKSGIIMLLLSTTLSAHSSGGKNKYSTDWNLARKSDDISLFYRWIQADEGIKTREMKVEFTIDAGIEEILEQFSSEKNYMKWAAGIKECTIESLNDSVWYTYTLMNYPWPLKKKDLVTKHVIHKQGHTTIIQIEASPNRTAKADGIERLEKYNGSWQLTTNIDGSTSLDYRVISFQKPILPRKIQDPLIQRISIHSLNELRRLAEEL